MKAKLIAELVDGYRSYSSSDEMFLNVAGTPPASTAVCGEQCTAVDTTGISIGYQNCSIIGSLPVNC